MTNAPGIARRPASKPCLGRKPLSWAVGLSDAVFNQPVEDEVFGQRNLQKP